MSCKRPFGHPTRDIVSQLPLAIQPALGSLVGSCSDLYVPPNPPLASSHLLFFSCYFFKLSGANCQEHNVQCHNLTAELSPFPAKYFLLDLFVAGHTGTLVLGGESYAGSQGFGIAWAHVPQGGQSWAEWLLQSRNWQDAWRGCPGMWLEGG